MSLIERNLHQESAPPPCNMEALESRLFFSSTGPTIPHGYSPLRWHGRDTYVRTAQWIIKIDAAKGSPSDQILSIQKLVHRASRNLNVRQYLGGDGTVLITSGSRAKFNKLLANLQSLPGFKYLEPDFLLQAAGLPNDPIYPSQDDLDNTGQSGGTPDADIDAPEAWQFTTGSPDVVVGVIDSGIDYTHPDLAPNIWTNPFEVPGDGIDNDGNGYIDDIHGWDFANDDNDPMDDNFHGTHVAGTIAAVGNNNTAIAGISWSSKLMALKILDSTGTGELSSAIAAINYADDMAARGVNIRLTNNSYGDPGFSLAMEDTIRASADAGLLFVAAAGNGGNDGTGDDNDLTPFYPASSAGDNIISVAATDNHDQKANFSNFGANSVDIGAPGVTTWSTARGGGVTTLSGTSMATPHVSGVAALAFSISPRGTPYSVIRDAILNGGDNIASLAGLTTTGKRLNAFGALAQLPLTVIDATPGPDLAVSNSAADYQLRFSHPILGGSIDPSDLLVNGIPADTSQLVNPTTVSFHFNNSPLSSQGLQTMQLVDGSITREFDLAASQPFSESFRYDALPMQVISSSISSGQVDLLLNEAIDPTSLSPADLQVDQVTVTGAQMIDPQHLRFAISGLGTEVTLHISLAAGALSDEFDNASLAYSNTLELDNLAPIALPTPLPRLSPIGSLIRGASATGLINNPADTDTFIISLVAGQSLSLAVSGSDGLQPTLHLLDPDNQILASATASTNIASATDILVPATGTYSIIIGADGETAGHYALRTSVNAALEDESLAGPSNDTTPTAQALGFDIFGNGASHAAVMGQTDRPVDVLVHESEPNDSTTNANSGARNFVAAPSDLYQMGIKGQIASSTDVDFYKLGDFQAGDVLTVALSGAGGPRGTLSDPFIELYRDTPDGPVLVTDDDDSGPGIDALINRFAITDAGIYFAKVRAYSIQTGTYDLALFLQNTDTPPGTGSATPIDTEPNDSAESAINAAASWKNVQYLSATSGSLDNTDHDIVSYVFHQGDLVTIQVDPTGGLRPRLTLRDASGNPIAADDGTSKSPLHSALIYTFIVPTSGIYYVDTFAKSGAGDYTSNLYLTSNLAPSPPTPAPDLYSFSLDAGEQASLILHNSGTGSLSLEILNPNGISIDSGIATANSSDQAIALFTAPTAGAYYARISGDRFEDYTLLVNRDAAFDLGNNDVIAAAKPIGNASAVLGNFDPDDDWYSLPISGGNTIQLFTSIPGDAGDTFDPSLEVYDPFGNLIAADDNSKDGRNALLTAKAPTSGSYRVHVGGSGSGEYVLNLTRFWALGGTSGDDSLYVRPNSQNGNVDVFLNTPIDGAPTYSLPPNLLSTIGLSGRGGNDQITFDGIALQLAQPSASTLLDVSVINGSQVSLQGSPVLGRLNLQDSSRAALTSGHNILRLSQIEISPDARLDLQDGSLIVQADEGSRISMLNLLTDRLRLSRGDGSWSGPGILTSSLTPDRAHTLGIMLNNNGGTPIKPTFGGQSIDANTILIGYSLAGDSDLDGDIDSDDYARIDNAFNSQLANPTYADGDFNYSGSINADDYFAIDRSFSSQ